MTYYDHATAMACKLDRWSEEPVLRNYELEALACEQRLPEPLPEKQSLFMRFVSVFRAGKASDKVNASISRKRNVSISYGQFKN